MIYIVLQKRFSSDISKFKVKVMNVKRHHAVFHLKNPFICEQYKKLFGSSKKPIDYYLAGLFAGASHEIIAGKVKCIETKCVAKGDEYCEFVIYGENHPEYKKAKI